MNAINSLVAVGLVVLPLLAWFAIVSYYMLRTPYAAGGGGIQRPVWAEALRWTALLVLLWVGTVGLFLLARVVDPSLSLFGPIDVP